MSVVDAIAEGVQRNQPIIGAFREHLIQLMPFWSMCSRCCAPVVKIPDVVWAMYKTPCVVYKPPCVGGIYKSPHDANTYSTDLCGRFTNRSYMMETHIWRMFFLVIP